MKGGHHTGVPELAPPRFVVFDWGGVFSLRAPGASRRAFERSLGLEPNTLGGFFREDGWLQVSTGRQTEKDFWNAVCAGFPAPPSPALAERLWDHLFLHGLVRRSVVEMATALRSEVTVSLLSNAAPSLRQVIAPVLPIFDDVVISAEVGCRKPEPEIFHLALARLGARPEEVLFIDDFRHNIAAAAELGIRGHRFLTPARLRAALERHGLLGAARMSPLKGAPQVDSAMTRPSEHASVAHT